MLSFFYLLIMDLYLYFIHSIYCR